MRSFLLTFALVSVLAAPGYSQQVVREDGSIVERYLPWVAPVEKDSDDIPVRYFYEAGDPIPEPEIGIIHMKDQSIFGWKYDNEEWELLIGGQPNRQEYYYDESRHQDNGGVITT